jgi:hemoglobin/transferrin/lactoferrin receptor protein
LAVTAHAQSASDPAIALDEITVSATRIAQPVSEVPASVSVIRLNDLLNSVTSLRDLARGEPGVSAPAAFGATGNAPRNFPTARSFNIRGLDGNRVLMRRTLSGRLRPAGEHAGSYAAPYADGGLHRSLSSRVGDGASGSAAAGSSASRSSPWRASDSSRRDA